MGYLIFLSILFGGVLQLLLTFIFSKMGYNLMNECSLGFSGVIFTLIVVECKESTIENRSVFFGMLNVPKSIYPIVLLIIIQFLFSGVSFIGHLSGMLIGYLWIYGFIDLILPSSQRIERWENGILKPISSLTGYINNRGETNEYLQTKYNLFFK